MSDTRECGRCDGDGVTRGRDGGLEVCACCAGSGELPVRDRDRDGDDESPEDDGGEQAGAMTPVDGSNLTADQRKEVETRADRRRDRAERRKRSLDSPGWT